MLKYMLVLIVIIRILAVNGSELQDDSVANETENTPLQAEENDNIEEAIADIENTLTDAEKVPRKGLVSLEEMEESYARVVKKLDAIAKSLQDSANAYKFLDANGIQRIISPNIGENNEQMIKALLTIIKTLFDVVPIKSKASVPTNVVDTVLDKFEDSENLELKTLSLDIMHTWLPNNPQIQARVMKIKGLEPFYEQLSKKDGVNGNKLLELFNIILEEHMRVFNNMQTENEDFTDIKIYETIGLIERMSTPIVCNGLLNVLELTSSEGITLQTFKLVKNVQAFCSKFYKGKTKAIKFFDAIYEYLSEKQLDGGMNITEEREGIKKYVDYLKVTRNEL